MALLSDIPIGSVLISCSAAAIRSFRYVRALLSGCAWEYLDPQSSFTFPRLTSFIQLVSGTISITFDPPDHMTLGLQSIRPPLRLSTTSLSWQAVFVSVRPTFFRYTNPFDLFIPRTPSTPIAIIPKQRCCESRSVARSLPVTACVGHGVRTLLCTFDLVLVSLCSEAFLVSSGIPGQRLPAKDSRVALVMGSESRTPSLGGPRLYEVDWIYLDSFDLFIYLRGRTLRQAASRT